MNRRFDLIGEKNGIKVYDDYGHHPTEVDVTLQAARIAFKNRIIVVFQPHLFSRTQDFYEEFAKALLTSDMLIVAKIYPAREEPIEGVTSRMISDASSRFGHKNVQYVEDVAKSRQSSNTPSRAMSFSPSAPATSTKLLPRFWRRSK